MIKPLTLDEISKTIEEEYIFVVVDNNSTDYNKHCRIKSIQTIAEGTMTPTLAISYEICDTQIQNQTIMSMKNGMDMNEITIFLNENFQLLSQHRETKLKNLLKYL